MSKQLFLIALAMLSLSLQCRPTYAMLIPSETSQNEQTLQRAEDLQTIQTTLEMKIIRQRLADLGFNADQIAQKLNSLSDEQLHQFAQQIDSVMVGGFHGADDLLHALLTILLIVAVVVLLLVLL